ncbi:hypothetical protein LJ656_01265 [Paraburkholderia sp. MMS20-SJTR3]|uniref:CdiI immunity protein domain-containing protein n=1 Tax=Paraburkholderia sejongensis TaxID=2886946 RepID=A0ABS8JMS4_9BURK|nr:contact-dependent growth inhibition system immunity protein [Paraburkholderia sp. MMS20-SJTR3]MCC8391203.1 hypothetical protein [Paraburkholderia sp. MMS20-SJTR3]
MKLHHMLTERHPRMNEIFGGYLNQDYDLSGNKITEIVSCYKKDSPPKYHRELITEILSFMEEYRDDLDFAYEKIYGTEFSPELWGHKTNSFLNELARILIE